MRIFWKSTAAAIALGAIAATITPAGAQGYDNGYGPPPNAGNDQTQGYGGYGPPPGYPYGNQPPAYGADNYGPPPNNNDDYAGGPPPGYGDGYANGPSGECDPANYDPNQPMPPQCQPYCDPSGCPDDFYDMPIWYGPVFYDDAWLNGPVYYRDGYDGRQYWIQGGWHYDAWRGPRPAWWNASRYHTGPALGRGTYLNHGTGHATNGVRVWRGGSPYFEGGGRRFERQGFAGPQNTGQAITHGNGQFANRSPRVMGGLPAQHGPQNRTGGGHSYGGNGHNFSAGQNHSVASGGGGHHDHGH